MNLIDLTEIEAFLVDARQHYEISAPTVEAYLNRLYVRLQEDLISVSAAELKHVGSLEENGIWMQPNHGANWVYKLQSELGQNTTAQIGF